jgi:hypothetical protein
MEGTHAWQDRCRRGRDQRVAGRRLASAHRSRRDQAVHVRVTGRVELGGRRNIVWKGEYDGKQYEDKGRSSGRPRDASRSPTSARQAENGTIRTTTTLVYELEEADDGTRIRLSQDNNASTGETESSGQLGDDAPGLKKVVGHRQPAAWRLASDLGRIRADAQGAAPSSRRLSRALRGTASRSVCGCRRVFAG